MRNAPLLTALALTLLGLLAACGPQAAPTATPTATRAPAPQAPAQPPLTEIPDAPPRDMFDLAGRYLGVDAEPLSASALYPQQEVVGTRRHFWVVNPLDPSIYQVEAQLRHVSTHANWYVVTDTPVSQRDLAETARRFEEEVLPHVISTFAPGLELGGPITIVTGELTGLGGYFNALDALPRSVFPHSNERAGVFMNLPIGTERYLGTLAHELQHVVHWLMDPAEETWTNEGLGEFAARSLGLPALPFTPYLREPEVPLTDWPEDVGDTLPSYAGASLFIKYLAQRTGVENIHRLVARPADGVEGVQGYLDEVAPGLRFEEVYLDWLIANLIGAPSGPYAYNQSPGTVQVERTMHHADSEAGEVPQLGAWYTRIEPDGEPLQIQFDGRAITPLFPASQRGESCWWSNRGDSINSTITRGLNLRGVDAATLRFRTWHHTEEHWDHGYISVSTDGGETWTALEGHHTDTEDPLGVALGPSYTGRSDGWQKESMDLSPYAGREVLLRFEYVTDEAIDTIGWCVSDIEVPEIGFRDNLGADAGNAGWELDGFVPITSPGVAQRFELRLVESTGNGTTVTPIALDGQNNASFTADRPATLVLTAIAPKTSEPAEFSIEASE